MSYLPIQSLNLYKAQINFIATTVTVARTIDLGNLVSDTNDIVKATAYSLTLKAGRSYFIFVSLSHTKTNRTSYDIYIDGVSLNMCKVELMKFSCFFFLFEFSMGNFPIACDCCINMPLQYVRITCVNFQPKINSQVHMIVFILKFFNDFSANIPIFN